MTSEKWRKIYGRGIATSGGVPASARGRLLAAWLVWRGGVGRGRVWRDMTWYDGVVTREGLP